MMTQLATLTVALRGIFANKLRSTLTVLGVIIGIASVIALSSVGEGSKQMITDRIGSLGSNLLTVSPGAASEGFTRMQQGSAQTLTYEDASAIASSPDVTAVNAVAPEASTNAQVVVGGENVNARIYGVTPEYEEVRNKTIAEGSFISQTDVDQKSSVAVLGSTVAEDLFGEANPVGQTIKLNQRPYTVVGVLESEEGMMGSDDSILVPITSVMYRLDPSRDSEGDHVISSIYLQAVSDSQNDLAIAQVTGVLQDEHRIALGDEDDFSITSMQDVEETLTETSETLTMLLTITAAIALLVAGLGIMNIMLVSVTERTKEIGIRLSIGARAGDILVQFLIEAVILSMLGGIIGILIGIGLGKMISGLINSSMIIDPFITLFAFFFSGAVGVFFGFYPARKASKLNPIDALHFE